MHLSTTTQEAAGGEEFGIEEGCAGGATHKIIREQSQLYIEEWAFADAAYHSGHARSGIDVTSRLRAIFLLKNDYRIAQG